MTWTADRLVEYFQRQGVSLAGPVRGMSDILDAMRWMRQFATAEPGETLPSGQSAEALRREYFTNVRCRRDQPDGGFVGNLLDTLWDSIAASEARLSQQEPIIKPRLAVANIGVANGVTLRGDDGYAVVIDTGLLLFCNMVSKIVVSATLNENEDGFVHDLEYVGKRLVADPDLRDRLCDLFKSYVVSSHPGLTPHWLPSPRVTMAAIGLTEIMESFLVAHEFAHIRLGHLEDVSSWTAAEEGVEDLPIISREERQEIEADGYAMFLILNGFIGKHNPGVVVYAVTLLMLTMATIDGFVAYLLGNSDELPSLLTLGFELRELGGAHPSPIQRIQIIRGGINNAIPGAEDWLFAQAMADAVTAWSPCATLLARYAKAIRAEGARPHPRLVPSPG